MKRKKVAYVVVAMATAGVNGFAQTKQVVAPPGLQIAGIPFSPGVKAGDLYHIAGTMGSDSAAGSSLEALKRKQKRLSKILEPYSRPEAWATRTWSPRTFTF